MNIALIDRARGLRRTVAGRAIQVCADIDRSLIQRPEPLVQDRLQRLRHQSRVYLDHRQRRDAQRTTRGDGRAAAADAQADIHLGIIYDTCDRFVRRAPHSPQGQAAQRILHRFFRRGLAAVVSIPFEDELVLAEYIHSALIAEHAADIATLKLEGQIEALGMILPEYRAALAREVTVTAQQVAEAYEAMQVAYFKLVFTIIGTVDDPDWIDTLLAPVFDQDQRLAALHAARRSGRNNVGLDLDAEAAEALAAAQAAEAALAAEAQAPADPPPAPEAAPAMADPEADPPPAPNAVSGEPATERGSSAGAPADG